MGCSPEVFTSEWKPDNGDRLYIKPDVFRNYFWHECGIYGQSSSDFLSEIRIWFGENPPRYGVPDDERRVASLKHPYVGTIRLWDTTVEAKSRIEDIQRHKPGLILKKFEFSGGTTLFCSSQGEEICTTSDYGGGVSICVDYLDGICCGVRFAWPNPRIVDRSRTMFSFADNERLVFCCEIGTYGAPRPLRGLFDLVNWAGFDSSWCFDGSESHAEQPVLWLTSHRLIAKYSDETYAQWPLNGIVVAEVLPNCPPETLAQHPIRMTPRERAADRQLSQKPADYEFRNAHVILIRFRGQTPVAFAFRMVPTKSCYAGILSDFVAQLTNALSRYGSKAHELPPLPSEQSSNRLLVKCPACGSPVGRNASTCAQCHYKFEPTGFEVNLATGEKTSKRIKIAKVLAPIAITGSLLLLLYIVFVRDGEGWQLGVGLFVAALVWELWIRVLQWHHHD